MLAYTGLCLDSTIKMKNRNLSAITYMTESTRVDFLKQSSKKKKCNRIDSLSFSELQANAGGFLGIHDYCP